MRLFNHTHFFPTHFFPAFVACIALSTLPSCLKREHKDEVVSRHYEQSIIESERGNINAALRHVNQALTIAPSARLKAYKAMLLGQLNNFTDSIALFEEVINHPKTSPYVRTDAMNNLAGVLVQSKEYDKAAILWRQLTRDETYLTPEVAHFNLGLLALTRAQSVNKGSHQDNQENQEKPVQEKPVYDTRLLKEALKEFNRAIAINREYVDALYYNALIYQELGNKKEARDFAHKVISLEPLHEGALDLLEELNT